MQNPKLKLYIGCSLTHAPKEFIKKVAALKKELRRDYEVLDFVGLENGTPEDVYYHDIHVCVATCDVFVAICDYPALGLGWELATAVEKHKKPVLALAHADAHITRLLPGAMSINSGLDLKRYRSFEEIPALVRNFVNAKY